jgi:ABC-type transport system involved in multi-copper enzyme maturation permease subunit
MSIFFVEVKKYVQQPYMYLGIASALVFSLLTFLFHLGDDSLSAFEFAISGLGNITDTFFILFPAAFCVFIFSGENSNRTEKIIRSKPISMTRVVSAKFLTALCYLVLLFLIVYGFLMILGMTFFTSAGMEAGLMLQGFMLQGAAHVFLICLLAFFTILFRSGLLGFGAALFTVVVNLFASNVEVIEPILPISRLAVYKEIITPHPRFGSVLVDLGVLAGYSLLLFCISIIVYRTREVHE